MRGCVEVLRRDGSVVVQLGNTQEVAEWRSAMRRACRAAGLRIRTGLSGADGVTWAYHVDHVVTEAAERAARRAVEKALDGQPPVPFHELVRDEQRQMLRVVPPRAPKR